MSVVPGELKRVKVLIAEHMGLDVPDSRLRRLPAGLCEVLTGTPGCNRRTGVDAMDGDPNEEAGITPAVLQLASYLTVGESWFFRDAACFEALEHRVFPALIASRRAEHRRVLRIWSAGCASGEEPYSLAMLLDRLLPERSEWQITILATDIDTDALARARRGLYREWSLREAPGWIRNRYFRATEPMLIEIAPCIRRMVTFAPLNLAAAAYPSAATNTCAMDLILCRNVVMYFTGDAARAATSRLAAALAPGGWLAVSPVEAVLARFEGLLPVPFPGAWFFRREPGVPLRPLPPHSSRPHEPGAAPAARARLERQSPMGGTPA